jgi:hypothetical protein
LPHPRSSVRLGPPFRTARACPLEDASATQQRACRHEAAGALAVAVSEDADPCRNITSGGHCSATLAVRCGTELDPPVISLLDCAEIDAVCKVDANGEAGCDDP